MLPFFFFFFNDTATTEIYTLSLHDALPIYRDTGHFLEIGDHVVKRGGQSADFIVAVDINVLIEVAGIADFASRSEEHTSELQSQSNLVCRLLLEKKK